MPRNVFIVLFTYITVSNDTIQLQIYSIKHYGTVVFNLFYTTLWEDSYQDKARAKCWSCDDDDDDDNNNSIHLFTCLTTAKYG
jgi:hypothetical protein